ncbi:MAG TPA: c-type cytochrome biogenesis protein CcmI [Burkholderiaceae bacterium]|nr:c-type cytochrome biogenesis protein CcmI [Burkholderiaceae bacterium]
MTAFVLISAAMAVVALALLTRPLWWGSRPAARSSNAASEASEQLRQLDALRASGTLTDAQASEARTKLEQRLGRAMTQPVQPAAARPQSAGMLSALALFALAVVVGGYATIGTPQALDPAVRAAGDGGGGHSITAEQIEAMVDKLATRLKENPGDIEGWTMLGRSYSVLGKHPQAMAAFKQAVALRPDDAVLLADYADSMAMVNGRNLEGEPSRLIARALEADPNNLKALSLAGTAAFMRKDYAVALRHWEKMQQVAPDSDFAKQIQGGIDEARRLATAAGQPAPAAAPPRADEARASGAATISGVVSLAAGLRGKAAPDDTLFVYARPAQGPRMPLAILRKQVKDLPLRFTLDDSMAMSPVARLSSARQVVVDARISKSGTATPQPGDLLGQSDPVSPGASGLAIEIGQTVGQ